MSLQNRRNKLLPMVLVDLENSNPTQPFDRLALFMEDGTPIDPELLLGSGGASRPVVSNNGLPDLSGTVFPYSVPTPDPGSGRRYASFPGFTINAYNEGVLVERIASGHTTLDSTLEGKISRDLKNWSAPSLIHTPANPASYDVRDPCLYCDPVDGGVYLTYVDYKASGPADWKTQLRYSSDGGHTFGPPIAIPAGRGSGQPIRRDFNGKFSWPFFKISVNPYEAWVLETETPLDGPSWIARKVFGTAGVDRQEWDYVEITPNLRLAAIRSTGNQGSVQMSVAISTDQGQTYSNPVALNTVSGMLYDGWPTPVLFADGSVGIFVRGTTGLRLVVCLDPTPANLVDPAQWSEPNPAMDGLFRPFDYIVGTSGIPIGKFQPVRIGRHWISTYYIELDTNRDKAEVRLGIFDERDSLNSKQLYTAANQVTIGQPTNAWNPLPTPRLIKFRTSGGKHRVSWKAKHSQASGTLKTVGFDVLHDGQRWNGSVLQTDIATPLGYPLRKFRESGTSVIAWNYEDEGSMIVNFGPGVHTLSLAVNMPDNTVGRTVGEVGLSVEPV